MAQTASQVKQQPEAASSVMAAPASPPRIDLEAAAAPAVLPQSPLATKTATATDVALLSAAQVGDFTAFEAIVQRYHNRVYRLVIGMVKNPLDAEEVVQETFLSAFRGLGSFKYESSPKTWISRIAVNAALMRLRALRRKPLLSLEDHHAGCEPRDDVPFWAPSSWNRLPEAAALSAELRTTIGQAVDKLPEKYRLVLLLRDVEGNNTEEVATTLGLTCPTVKSRLHRARLFVRQELETYFRRH